jgi:peroxiredoxin Q/BCP
MSSLLLGQKLPDIEFTSTSPQVKRFTDLPAHWLVIYFYPKDDTSGCTCEAENFRDNYNKFQERNTYILGVSRDKLNSHMKFKEKLQLPFELISDPAENLCQWFGVIKNKKMYGKNVRGIDRSTFLFDPNGKLQHEWRGVKVPNHVIEVLNAIAATANND